MKAKKIDWHKRNELNIWGAIDQRLMFTIHLDFKGNVVGMISIPNNSTNRHKVTSMKSAKSTARRVLKKKITDLQEELKYLTE